jgi:uncharacterized protein YegL
MEEDKILTTSITFEYDKVLCTQQTHVYLMVSLKCPKILKTERAPIDLLCVIDKSGSMSGKNIELVQTSLHFIVDQLQPKDRLGIITFATLVTVDIPYTFSDSDGKLRLHQIIDNIVAVSSTNLCGALETAIDLVDQSTEYFR